MTSFAPRPAMLRIGYAGLGIGFLALAATFTPAGGAMLVLGLFAAFAGAVALTLSREDLAKWAGIVLVAYFVLTFVVFLVGTPWTIQTGSDRFFVNKVPPALARALFDALVVGLPLVLAGATTVGAWERPLPARILLILSISGFILVGALTLVLVPGGVDPDSISRAASTGGAMQLVFALSALLAAAGAAWAAARPQP